jgi:uncharacterized repeat protein (TIGR02543 family)
MAAANNCTLTGVPTATNNGYDFGGWFNSQDAAKNTGSTILEVKNGTGYADVATNPGAIPPNLKISSATTVYARWTYVIVYDANGGTLAGGGQVSTGLKVIKGSPQTLAAAPTKQGMTFLGWKLDASAPADEAPTATSCSGCMQASFTDIAPLSTASSSTRTLYAVWKPNTTMITLDLQGGTFYGSTTNPQVEAVNGYDMPTRTMGGDPLEPDKIERCGYIFKGFYEDKKGALTQYYTNTFTSKVRWDKTGNSATLYASWQAENKTVIYNNRPTTGTTNVGNTEPYTVGTGIYTNPTITNTLYTLEGIYEDASFQNKKTNSPFVSTTECNDVNVYLKWYYTVKYNLNGGSTITGRPSDELHYYNVVKPQIATNQSVSQPPTEAFEKEGYEFMGWAVNQNATAAIYSAGQVLDASEEVPRTGTSVTLYAVWSPKIYQLTYDHDGGTCACTNGPITYMTTVSLPTATDATRTFVGWQANNSGATLTGNWQYNIAADVTMKAIWTPNPVVTFVYYNGSPNTNVTLTALSGTVSPPSPAPTRVGYDFKAWRDNNTCTGADFNFSATISANKTLYACWEPRKYDVTLNSRATGVTVPTANEIVEATFDQPMPTQTKTGGTALTKPVRTGYDFKGYENSTQKYYDSVPAGVRNWDIAQTPTTLNAVWLPHTTYIQYNCNGGSGGSGGTFFPYKYEQGTKLNHNTCTKTGYYFYAWCLTPLTNVTSKDSISEPTYSDELAVVHEFYPGYDGAQVPIFAVWLPDTFVLQLNTSTNTAAGGLSPTTNGTFAGGVVQWEKWVKYDAATGALPTPTLTGYRFTGWNTNQSGGGADTLAPNGSTIWRYTANTTFYAQWVPEEFSLKFQYINPDTRTIYYDTIRKVQYDRVVTLPTPPTWTGYDFNGWATIQGTTYDGANDIYKPSLLGSDSVRSLWTAHRMRLYLNKNYAPGAALPSFNLTYNERVGDSLPVQVGDYMLDARTGYVFAGWYDEPSGGIQYNRQTIWRTDRSDTLYAKWDVRQFKVIFDEAGGTCYDCYERGIKYDDALGIDASLNPYPTPRPMPTINRPGYTFGEWFRTDSLNGAAVLNGTDSIFYDGTTIFQDTNDLYLRAKWTAKRYNVKLEGNGGKFNNNTANDTTISIVYDDTLGWYKPVRTGYTFSHYSTMRDGSGNAYYRGGIYNLATSRPTNDTTLWAQWNPNTYKIKYIKINNITTAIWADSTYGNVQYERTLYQSGLLRLPLPTAADYVFGGWYTEAGSVNTCGGEQYTLSKVYNTAHDTTLYACWYQTVTNPGTSTDTAYQIWLDYMHNDAIGTTLELSKIVRHGGTYTPPPTTDSRFLAWEGNKFDHWYEDTSYLTAPVMDINPVIRNDTLYARWQVQKYRAMLVGRGGTYADSTGSPLVSMGYHYGTTYIEDSIGYAYSFTAAYYQPKRFGYDFDGYWDDTIQRQRIYWNYLKTSDDTLYAKWRGHVHQISFDGDGGLFRGANGAPKDVEYGLPVGRLSDIDKTGYTFAGWMHVRGTAPGDTTIYNIQTVYLQDSSIVLKAWWKPNPYTIILKGAGGQYSHSGTPRDTAWWSVYYESKLGQNLPIPVRAGYNFEGYYTQQGGAGQRYDTASTMYDVNLTSLFANWTPGNYQLCFNANGGTPATIPCRPETYRVAMDFMPNVSKQGYDFVRWDTLYSASSAATGVRVYAGLAYPFVKDVTVYAIWAPKRYTIRYDPMGASNASTFTAYQYIADHGGTMQDPFGAPNTVIEPIYGGASFEGWVPSTSDYSTGPIWNWSTDVVTSDLVMRARWQRWPITVDNSAGRTNWPTMHMTYGQRLGQATNQGGSCCTSVDGGPAQSILGTFRFVEQANATPTVRDSARTRYLLHFIPNDSLIYQSDTFTTVVHVSRRSLTVTPKTISLVLALNPDGTEELRRPQGLPVTQANLSNYYNGRVNTSGEGYATIVQQVPPYPDAMGTIFGGGFDVDLKDTTLCTTNPICRYDNYKYIRSYIGHVIAKYPFGMCLNARCETNTSMPWNYRVNFTPGNLWVTRITYLPSDSIVYGDELPLNATHTFERYNRELKYYSSNQGVIRVQENVDNKPFYARAVNVGSTEIYVTLDEKEWDNPPMPADTMSVQVDVVPKRNLSIEAHDMTIYCGRPFDPANYLTLTGTLVQPDSWDSLYRWGFDVMLEGEGNHVVPGTQFQCPDLPNAVNPTPTQWMLMRPAANAMRTRKYADWAELVGKLTIKKAGKDVQVLKWLQIPDTVQVGETIDVFAHAYDSIQGPASPSREVNYMLSRGGNVDSITLVQGLPATFNLSPNIGTIYGEKIRFNHSGVAYVTAYQLGDTCTSAATSPRSDGTCYIPKTIIKQVYVRPSPQEILNFSGDTAIPIGGDMILEAQVTGTHGRPVRFDMEDPAGAAAITELRNGSDYTGYGILFGQAEGRVRVRAYENGDDDWGLAQAFRNVVIYDPNKRDDEGFSTGTDVGGGAGGGTTNDGGVIDEFTPVLDSVGYHHWRLSGSCKNAILTVKYNEYRTRYVLVKAWNNGSAHDTTFYADTSAKFRYRLVAPMRMDSIVIVFHYNNESTARYRIDVQQALNGQFERESGYIYYSPKFPHRVEVVNNIKVHPAQRCTDGCLKYYRWYRNDSLVYARDGMTHEDSTVGIFYRDNVSEIAGYSFMVKAWYADGTVVWICEHKIEAQSSAGLRLFPNPVGSMLTVRHPMLNDIQQSVVTIYSAGTGALVKAYTIMAADVSNGEVSIDMSSLEEGAYVVRFAGEAAIVVKRKN